MFTIGAFAQLTGLPAKTLRYYHDRGLLVPAHVDPETGYRAYALHQADDAARIVVLRRGGMPVELIRTVVEEPDRAAALIGDFQEELRRRRRVEDRALESALAAARTERSARVRSAPALPYAAVTVVLRETLGSPSEGAETNETVLKAVNEDVDRRAERLRAELVKIGREPSGDFWTTLGAEGEALAVTPHWPLERPGDADLARTLSEATGAHVLCGVLPAREEAYVEIPLPDTPGDESVQLALSAVFAAGCGRGHGVPRQTVHHDRGTVEFALTLKGQQ